MRSLNFIMKRIEDGHANIDENWIDFGSFREYNFIEALSDVFDEKFITNEEMILKTKYERNNKTTTSELYYNPDAEFDYFTMQSCLTDGTLMFMSWNFKDIIEKILKLETVCVSKMPDDFEIGKYDIRYTVGDFVCGYKYCPEDAPEDKKWMSERMVAMLPIKFEIINKGE